MARRKSKKTYVRFRQTGESNLKMDRKRYAQEPGKRKSAGGKTYYEYRRNRTDLGVDRPSPSRRGLRRKVVTKTSSAGKRYKSYVWVKPKSKKKR